MTNRGEMLVVAAGRITSALLALAAFAVFTRLLPPAEYALLALLTAFSAFASLIVLNPCGQWLQRHLHEWEDAGRLWQRLKEVSAFIALAGVVIGIATGIWYFLAIQETAAEALAVAVSVAAFILFSTLAQALGNTLNALGRRVQGVLWQVAGAGLPLVMGAIFTSWRGEAVYWVAGQALGGALASWGAILHMRRRYGGQSTSTERDDSTDRRVFFVEHDYWHFALPLTGVTGFFWLEGNGYRFILERGWDPAMLGLFLLALSIPAQMTAVVQSFISQYAYPYYYRNLAGLVERGHQSQITAAMMNVLLPLYWAWGGFLLILAPQFLFLFAGSAYHGAEQWVLYGCLLEMARLTGNVWSLAGQATKNYRPIVFPFGWGAAGSLAVAMGTVWLDFSPTFFAAGLVGVVAIKAGWIAMRAQRMLDLSIAWRRPALAAVVFAAAFLFHSLYGESHGVVLAFAILVCAGLLAVMLGYFHLRTSPEFRALSQVKLG